MPGHRDQRDRGPRWRRTRRFVLDRDGNRCQIQIAGICLTIADCVHHTLGWAISGDNPAHLIAACTPCNLRIGEPDGGDAQPRRTTRW